MAMRLNILNMRKLYLLIIWALPLAALAQSKLPENIFLNKLPNGLEVLVVEDNTVPLATISFTFKSGPFKETEVKNGLIGFYTGMLFRGNKNFINQNDFNYHAGQLGLQAMNEVTNQESSQCCFTISKSILNEGLEFMNSAIRFSNMSPEQLDKEKDVTGYQLKQKESNPNYILISAMSHHLWGKQYYKKNAIGNLSAIQSATHALMDSIKNKYYFPNNAFLVVGGDVKHGDVFKQVESIYGNWKAGNLHEQKEPDDPEFKPILKYDYFIEESTLAASPVILVNWQGPDTRNDISSTYAADVFTYIVNERTSKLNNALIATGLAYSASLNYLTQKYVGPISFRITPNPARMKECVNEIKRQLTIMDNDSYITDDQIETAKRMLEIKRIRQEEITSDYVHTLSFWWASASINYLMDYNENIKKITRADIKSFIDRYINKPYCAGLLIAPDLNSKLDATSFFTSNIN